MLGAKNRRYGALQAVILQPQRHLQLAGKQEPTSHVTGKQLTVNRLYRC